MVTEALLPAPDRFVAPAEEPDSCIRGRETLGVGATTWTAARLVAVERSQTESCI